MPRPEGNAAPPESARQPSPAAQDSQGMTAIGVRSARTASNGAARPAAGLPASSGRPASAA